MHILTWPVIKYLAMSFGEKNEVLFSSLWLILLNKLWTVKAFFSSKVTCDRITLISQLSCVSSRKDVLLTPSSGNQHTAHLLTSAGSRDGEPSAGSPVDSHKRRTGSNIKGHLFCLNFSRNKTRSLLRPDPSFGWTALLKGRFLPWASCSLASINLAPFWISGS